MSLQVNIDFYTREIISQCLQQPSPSCFVVAQRKIYSLMENGSFPRFIQSEQYKVLFDATSKPRGPGKHRKALKIKSTGDLMQHDSKPIILQSELYLLHKDWHCTCRCCKALHGHRLRHRCWQTGRRHFPFLQNVNNMRLGDKTQSCPSLTDITHCRGWHLVHSEHCESKTWTFHCDSQSFRWNAKDCRIVELEQCL